MRGRTLFGIIAGIVGMIVIIASVVFLTLRNQNQVYTSSGRVDLNSPQEMPRNDQPATPTTISIPSQKPTTTQVTTTYTPRPAEDSSTPLSTPISPTPQSLLPATPIFYDDFTDLTSGWSPLFLDVNGNFSGYSSGVYHIDAGLPDTLLYDIESRKEFGTGRYAVDIFYEGGVGTFGLLLGVQGDLNQPNTLTYTTIGMSEQGAIVIGQRTLEGEETIAQSQPTPTRFGALSRLSVDANETELVVYINDTVALRTSDLQLQKGYVGIFTQSNGEPLHIGFDNLLVLAQPPGNQPACAAIRPLFIVGAEQSPAQGDDVQILRERLYHLGYITNQEDIPFDKELAESVATFQTQNSLQPTSAVDGVAWCQILSDTAIRGDSSRTERAEYQYTARSVSYTSSAIVSPLAVSVRQADKTWSIALALPTRSELLYIELGGDALDPTWAPNADSLAFTSNRSGIGAVWHLDFKTRMLRQLTPNDQDCQFPTWSPDSTMLIVTCEPLDHPPLAARDFVIDIAQGQMYQLSNDHAGWADWSATNEILYTHWTGKSFDLIRANPDGSGAINLTNTDGIDEDIASWSPDGSYIAFVANPRGQSEQRQIFTIQRDGSGITQQTIIPGPNSNPVWSPDGQTIVFANQNNGDLQPWMLHIGTTQLQQISSNDDRIWFINWARPKP